MPHESNAPRPAPETICAHWGEDRTQYKGAVIPPIYQNSLFTAPTCEAWEAGRGGMSAAIIDSEANAQSEFYDYTRVSNPTTDIVEAKIAALEGGERARCFGSGMGAISAAILSCVKTGDHIVAPETVYGPTRQFLAGYCQKFQIETTFVDGGDRTEWENAVRPNTRLLYLESPSSFLMKQQNLRAVADLAGQIGAATICDNSWATPIFQNPLAHGVDIVVHTATKYLGGHSDVVAGAVIGSTARMRALTIGEGCLLGAVIDPFAAWLLLRGLRTLPLRMERHQQTARRLALALYEHPAVARVYYPGLPDDCQPDLTKTQLRGTSGLLAFELETPGKQAAYRAVNGLKYYGIGCSWGGFESLAIPAFLPASAFGPEQREGRWLIRLHVGLEGADDLWNDLAAALAS